MTSPIRPASGLSRSLLQNMVYNTLGRGLPMVAALVAVPVIVDRMGTERYGVLSIAWLFVGYFSLFDLGVGQALTQMVSKKLGAGREQELPAVIRTGLALMLLLGAFAGLAFGLLIPSMVHEWLRIPKAMQPEASSSFYLLAASIPFVMTTIGFRSVLEAHQRFDFVNAVSVPLGVYTYVGPLLVLAFSTDLSAIVAALMFGRVIQWAALLVGCLHTVPGLTSSAGFDLAAMGPLLRFGGWMTVPSIIGPVMVYVDRFLIGMLASMSAVAYYATPHQMVSKLTVVSAGVAGVLFPAFATTFVYDRERTVQLFDRTVKLVFLVMFPVVLLIVAFAREGLNLWLGSEFALNSTAVLQWLAAGVLLNGFASIPFALVKGAGLPSIVAKLHLIELPLYLLMLRWLLGAYGVEGAAVAWTVRMLIDSLALFAAAHRLLEIELSAIRDWLLCLGASMVTLLVAASITTPATKALFAVMVLPSVGLFGWYLVLGPSDRALVQDRLIAIRGLFERAS